MTKEELGGAMTHNERSGVAHFAVSDDRACLLLLRDLPLLPSNNSMRRRYESRDSSDREDELLDRLVPASPNQPYDMLDLIHSIADEGELWKCTGTLSHSTWASPILAGVRGHRREPASILRVLDIDASVKGARFVRFCDAFNIPAGHIRTCRDSPGYRPGIGGIIKHGAKLLHAFAEATVPKVTVITRRHGGAYCVMSSKHPRTDQPCGPPPKSP